MLISKDKGWELTFPSTLIFKTTQLLLCGFDGRIMKREIRVDKASAGLGGGRAALWQAGKNLPNRFSLLAPASLPREEFHLLGNRSVLQ